MDESHLPEPWTGEPVTYEERIVAFFDVLGWKDIITRADRDPARLGQLRSLVGFYGYLQGQVRGDTHGSALTAFSDNVVVSQRYQADAVQDFVDTIGRFQFAAALNGFFVRGAVTVGSLFHDQTSVFGPALIRAYELECGEVIYPRIVLDPDSMNAFGRLKHVRTLDGYPTVDTFGAGFVLECATPSVEHASSGPSTRLLPDGMVVLPAAQPRMILANVDASLKRTTVATVRTKLLWLKEQVEAGIASIT